MKGQNMLLKGAFWIGLYVMIAVLPLVVVAIGPTPPGREFWREFSVALGFAGLSMLAMQFIITARFSTVSAPYGLDVVLQFHRLISLVAFTFVLVHPIILFIIEPETIRLLNVFEAPWRARFAVLATLGLLVVVVTSLWRRRLGLSYEAWRAIHGWTAVAIVGFGLLHAIGVGHYLSLWWKQVLWAAMGFAVIFMLFYVRSLKPLVILRRKPWRVVSAEKLQGDSWAVRLEPDGHEGFRFIPGQFAWIKFGDSILYREHPFSISNSAEDERQVEFTIKEAGDFTERIGRHARPGTKAYIDGPRGVFSPDRFRAPGYVLVGGGIGISPLIGILRTLADRGFTGDLLLMYANKDEDSITYRDELERLESMLNLKVVHALNEPGDDWQGETGFIDREMLEKYLPEERDERGYFICGPPPMMNAVRDALVELDVPPDQIHMEYFQLVD
jgi:predicted ferric reductase